MTTRAIAKSTKRFIVGTAILGASILAMTAQAGQAATDQKGICAFTEYLQDPNNRAVYLEELAQASRVSRVRYGDVEEMYNNVVRTSYQGSQRIELDVFSTGCIGCHDGMNAPTYNIRYKNDPASRYIDIHSVIDSHPIGMDYMAYARYDEGGLKPIEALPSGMAFIGGKVGCLTCHNPLNPERGHLVMSNAKSALCFSCHNK